MKKSELVGLIKEQIGAITGYQVMNPIFKNENTFELDDDYIDEEVGAQKIVLPKLIKLTGDNDTTREFAKVINDSLTEKQLNVFFKWLTKIERK